MNMRLFGIIIFTIFFSLLNFNSAIAQNSAKEKTIKILPNKTTIEEEAENFAIRIGQLLDMDDTQISKVKTIRIDYLHKFRKLEKNSTLTLEQKRVRLRMFQEEYDTKFTSLLTPEQQERIKKRSYIR